jgi:oligopeptide/dipeptide ABC transporter ATP-binding protein
MPEALPGEVPDPAQPPNGCRFHPRCPYVFDRCTTEVPPLYHLGADRTSACFLRDPATQSTEETAP